MEIALNWAVGMEKGRGSGNRGGEAGHIPALAFSSFGKASL